MKETVVLGRETSVAPLLKRVFMFLEDGEWDRADNFCEQVLNQEPENAQAYLGKLMAELHVKRQEDLSNCELPFNNSNNYKKAVRFGGDKIAKMLSGYIDQIKERNENARVNGIYDGAVNAMDLADNEETYKSAAEMFKTIPGFKDADYLAEMCLDRAEVCRKDVIYASARSQMTGNAVSGYEAAIKTFSTISGWKDTDEQIYICQRKIEEIEAKEEAARLERERQAEQKRIAAEKAAKKRKRTIAIVTPIIVACIAFAILLTTVIIPKQKLNKAIELLNSGDYETAYVLLDEIGNNDVIKSSKYEKAVAMVNSGNYDTALILLEGLNYKDSADYIEKCYIGKFGEENYNLIKNVTVGDTWKFGSYEQDNKIENGKEEIEWIILEKDEMSLFLISKYALDCQLYNSSSKNVTWETCSLRKWLNETFLNDAFSLEEQNSIIDYTVIADSNPRYSTSPGKNTTDKVFLLSINEVNKYFSSNSARQCQGTEYCYEQGANKAKNGNCWWRLRTPGRYSNHAAIVSYDGSILNDGYNVKYDYDAVRPALWINLGS